jgi:hypothetical protein
MGLKSLREEGILFKNEKIGFCMKELAILFT